MARPVRTTWNAVINVSTIGAARPLVHSIGWAGGKSSGAGGGLFMNTSEHPEDADVAKASSMATPRPNVRDANMTVRASHEMYLGEKRVCVSI
jgi:hypothetical protein